MFVSLVSRRPPTFSGRQKQRKRLNKKAMTPKMPLPALIVYTTGNNDVISRLWTRDWRKKGESNLETSPRKIRPPRPMTKNFERAGSEATTG